MGMNTIVHPIIGSYTHRLPTSISYPHVSKIAANGGDALCCALSTRPRPRPPLMTR